jgi:hypothetical protein
MKKMLMILMIGLSIVSCSRKKECDQYNRKLDEAYGEYTELLMNYDGYSPNVLESKIRNQEDKIDRIETSLKNNKCD